MTSCKRAAELVTLGMEAPLSWPQRLALSFHMTLCGMCRRFRRQVQLVQSVVRGAAERSTADATLSPAARDRIRAALRQSAPGDGPE